MAVKKTVFVCNGCSYEASKQWFGNCPGCKSANYDIRPKYVAVAADSPEMIALHAVANAVLRDEGEVTVYYDDRDNIVSFCRVG